MGVLFLPRPQVAGLNEGGLSRCGPGVIICVMSQIVGYMVTWTTYGSWLRGDKRGYVENGSTLPGNPRIQQRNGQRQKAQTVKLNAQEKRIVRQTIVAEAKRIGHKIEGLAVCSNHVHIGARAHSQSIEELVGRYKSLTTRGLWRQGRKGRIWTKGYDKRFCFTEAEFVTRIGYVEDHKND